MDDEIIVSEIIEEFANCTARIGFPKNMGHVWGILYFKGPLTQKEIAEKLDCGISSVSQSLSMLQNVGFVHICGKKGRKKIYETKKSIQKAKRYQMENILHFSIEPMKKLLASRRPNITNRQYQQRTDELSKYFTKIGKFLEMILKTPFGK